MPITKILHEIAFATGPNDNCTKLNEYQMKKGHGYWKFELLDSAVGLDVAYRIKK